MCNRAVRLRRAKGHWMRLTSAELLRGYMKRHDFSGARLGRYAECSRQFVAQLLNGQVTTCTPELARRIEEALQVLPGTLFVDPKSTQTRHAVARDAQPARKSAPSRKAVA